MSLLHKPIQVGRWTICSICTMVKRKNGWWKPCPGPKPVKRYMAEG
jgi:hypothetical protein